jgi:uncharacterized protein (DUF1697 family)
MTTYVALLRGINVGGSHPVPMAELRAHFESLGFTAVETFIQSGNVCFSSRTTPSADAIAASLTAAYGFALPVVVRTAAQMERVVADLPFPSESASKVHVGFMAEQPPDGAVDELDGAPFEPDEFAIVGDHLYLLLPNGMGRTKLPGFLERRLKIPTTIRNWNTVNALVELTTR